MFGLAGTINLFSKKSKQPDPQATTRGEQYRIAQTRPSGGRAATGTGVSANWEAATLLQAYRRRRGEHGYQQLRSINT